MSTIHETPAEAEANARLIAAAPELLAALKRILGEFQMEFNHEYKGGVETIDGCTLQNRLSELAYAETLIAKAEGRK